MPVGNLKKTDYALVGNLKKTDYALVGNLKKTDYALVLAYIYILYPNFPTCFMFLVHGFMDFHFQSLRYFVPDQITLLIVEANSGRSFHRWADLL